MFSFPIRLLTICILLAVCSALRPSHYSLRSNREESFQSPYSDKQQQSSDNQTYNPPCPILIPQHPPQSISRALTLTQRNEESPYKLSAQQRIVGGQPINDDLSKYVAYLVQKSTRQNSIGCTSVIVAPKLLLTAAHCTMNSRKEVYDDLQVIFNATRGYNGTGTVYGVKSIHPHPMFSLINGSGDFSEYAYDIAFIRLRNNVPSYSKFMKVNADSAIPKVNSAVRVAGYGNHYFINTAGVGENNLLYQVDVPVASTNICRTRARGFNATLNGTAQFCAGYQINGGCGTCFGDSGGPIIQYDNFGEPVLVGITSLGFMCDTTDFPSIYVRTSPYISDFLPASEINVVNETAPVFLSGDDLVGPGDSLNSSTAPEQPTSESDDTDNGNGDASETFDPIDIPSFGDGVEPSSTPALSEEPMETDEIASPDASPDSETVESSPSDSVTSAVTIDPEISVSVSPTMSPEAQGNNTANLETDDSSGISTSLLVGLIVSSVAGAALLLIIVLIVMDQRKINRRVMERSAQGPNYLSA